MSSIPPGWYPDGSPANTTRYWDGQAWTEMELPPQTEAFAKAFGARAPFVQPRQNGVTHTIQLSPEQSRIAGPIIAMVLGLFLVVFGVIGLGMSTFTSTVFEGFNEPPEGSIETTATVVDIVFDSEGNCSPMLEFVEDGVPVQVRAPLSATPCQWSEGETVVAYYVPGQLQQTGTTLFKDDGVDMFSGVFGMFSLINPVLIGLGSLIVVLGLWRLIVNVRRARQLY